MDKFCRENAQKNIIQGAYLLMNERTGGAFSVKIKGKH
jgi:hypothetical protein